VRSLRAELLKTLTTRLLVWYGLALVAFLALVVSSHIGSEDRLRLATASTQRSVFDAAGLAAVTAVLLGSLVITSEYNHGTLNQSLLAVPVRERLLAAKLGAAALVAVALAVLGDVATLGIAELWYAGRGVTLELGGATLTPLLGAVGASALAAAIGLGLGAFVRRQTASIVAILLWLLIGESVVALIEGAAPYAPGHAVAAVAVARRHGGGETLGVWPAVAASLVYAVILLGAGAVVMRTSDVPSGGD
jgi:ABC-2 type transport system permease protein